MRAFARRFYLRASAPPREPFPRKFELLSRTCPPARKSQLGSSPCNPSRYFTRTVLHVGGGNVCHESARLFHSYTHRGTCVSSFCSHRQLMSVFPVPIPMPSVLLRRGWRLPPPKWELSDTHKRFSAEDAEVARRTPRKIARISSVSTGWRRRSARDRLCA